MPKITHKDSIKNSDFFLELREDSVETLLATACLLQIEAVTQACCAFLAHQLHPSNCLGIALFAEHQSCPGLLSQAAAYTSEHFMQVIRNQEFLQLSVDQLAHLLGSEDLNVPSEQDIFHALMNWVKHDQTNRQQHMSKLLALVKLPLLEPSVSCIPYYVSKQETSLTRRRERYFIAASVTMHVRLRPGHEYGPGVLKSIGQHLYKISVLSFFLG